MTIRDLEIFIAVAETGKMRSAAKKLYISQPVVSHVISKIEEEYNVKLFDRLSKKLYITEIGSEFLDYAKKIVDTFYEMEDLLYNASDHLCLHIGASLTVGSFFLSDIISQFEEKNPRIRIRVYIDNSKNIIEKIMKGNLDIAVIEGNVSIKDILFKKIYNDEMVLICGKKHPFAFKDSIDLLDLKNQDFVLREEGSGTREFLIDLLKSQGIPIVEKWTCHSSDSIINVVASGQGLSILSKSLVIHQNNVKQVSIRNFVLHRSFKLIYHKDKYLSPVLKSFISEIENLL
ncbi:LysR family transcriptional regulator [Garciella nitratireducens]|uniref:DNA-binding transcriptional regulator, LysR family n=1 Tax=Garciella nitratireducens DSM 15102 TaxID=1121911 RepID=A0A1T4MVR5_9FIRM|nr:LysR family transcriptional regulator [Garciella nitratireducens]RBP44931.1 DNA-binding transcriptional LysR family regulator [Garciella nitratireducens]SJZ71001.1 DNA-binding transcriptional regulator, LysR family [Garciella nitratireducens DSM 15102]